MLLNVLGRLGLSLVPGTWMNQPYFIIIPEDAILFYTKDFVVAVLLWEPGVLLGNGIQPSKFCTIGLLIVYSSFQIGQTFWIPFNCLYALEYEFKMRIL